MTTVRDLFFPPGTHVLTLPNWQNPRLYFPAHRLLQRWRYSSFYPAFRVMARLYKLSLRIRVTLGFGEVRKIQSGSWPLGEFVREVRPRTNSVVVLVGTPGPAQKITAQLRDKTGEVLGYLKYAEKEAARKRLRRERQVLAGIPRGVGPALLKYGTLGSGEALLTTPLPGKALPATLPPARDPSAFLTALNVAPHVPIAAHPWVQRTRDQSGFDLDPWLEMLSGKYWPVTIQHGDFAPWNLLLSDGALRAIDWEYGTLEGFPYLDLAYYVLQISALIYRWAPLRAMEYTVEYLTRHSQLTLSGVEARALTSLAAYDAYRKFREDGHLPDISHLQRWRKAIWEAPICDA
jgi:hypothetical protein